MTEYMVDSTAVEPSLRLSPGTFDRLSEFITKELGIKMPESKTSMIQSRLLRRIRELGLSSIDDYCQQLFSSTNAEQERVHFINAITTNKTDFFREPQHFKILTQKILPQLNSSNYASSNGRFSVWSAACSSGEEPYTLAMVLNEYGLTHPQFGFRILATDVSTKVLQKAKDGIYTKPQILPVPPELRRKYLLHSKQDRGALVRVTSSLRETISFHHLNFMDAEYRVKSMFDVIFCRNVLIYFDRPTQEAVIKKLCRNLVAGGYLFISHSESLSGLDLPLVSVGASCFRRLPS